MSDDDDFADFSSTKQSSNNLANLFHGEPAPTTAVATTTYVAPKQPKKDSSPKVMIATVIQAFSFGADQKWTPKGKIGVALLSTDNTIFQLILYVTKTQHITSARITTSSVFTPQSSNYLSFQDDGGQNWSIMFDTKQAIVDFALQIVLAKAYLFSFKFDHIIQDVREGEGSVLADHDSVEVTTNTYKLLENGTIQSTDTGEVKPIRFKIGKQQNGKTFDDVLRGMKKNGQRVAMIGTAIYSIEIVRIKREKEARSGSITAPAEAPIPTERKRTVTEDNENDNEKNKMIQRLNKMGAVSMMGNQTQSSAFAAPLPPHLSDDDSINNEFIQNIVPPRSMHTPQPPVQFVSTAYHPHPQQHLHPQPLIQHQPLIQNQPLYSPQQPLHDYNNRPGSSMSAMGYQQVSMWPHSQYPQSVPNIPPTDMYYQQQQQQQLLPAIQPDVRQVLSRLTEKVDVLTEKFDTKNSTTYPNMETSILLSNIQRIVKENDTMKKDLFDRSAKVEELNSKISELLDRNQRLIEQSHQTFENQHNRVNNDSEQTAQKILDLQNQKVELTNNLSLSTSKIADLQLQLNQYTQGSNESQSRITSLTQKCEQYKDEVQKSEVQRSELQIKLETIQEQFKNEKTNRKQLQTNFNTLEEELAEMKLISANYEKGNNERKMKYENERKRWQDDIEEQKQAYEKELDELKTKLRKQRSTDSSINTQEITRIEQDLEKEWQEKLERQQTQHERLLNSKGKELEQFKVLFNENEIKLQQITEELDESKQQVEAYEERCEKLQERLLLMKEKIIELNEEQPQLINEQVKSAVNIIFQSLKRRIQPTKRYTGEQVLTRSLEIIKKATLKVLSNNEDEDEQSSDEIQSDDDNQTNEQIENNDQPLNGNSVDQQTLNEEISSIPTSQNQEINSTESETSSTNNHTKGWDTVDDLQQESKTQSESSEENQVVLTAEDSTSEVHETETTSSDPVVENDEPSPPSKTVEEERDSDGTTDTVEENDKESSSPPQPPPELEIPKEKTASDEGSDDEIFQSARPSVQDIVPRSSITQSAPSPRHKFNEKITMLTNPDESDDELFK